jgi:hypothetical protein
MAVAVTGSGVISLAEAKIECGKLAQLLSSGAFQGQFNPSLITMLKAINASADTTDLRTT